MKCNVREGYNNIIHCINPGHVKVSSVDGGLIIIKSAGADPVK